MSFVDITALAAELCLYMASVGYFAAMFGKTLLPLWYFGVFFVCGVLCSLLRKKGALRFAPLALLSLAFVGAESIPAVILPIPAVFMLWLKAKKRVWLADQDRARSMFSLGFGVLAADFFAAFVSSGFTLMANTALPFFVVWLMLSVLILRLLRNPASNSLRLRVMNVMLVVLISGAGLVLSSDVCVSAVLAAASAVYNYLVLPLLIAAIAIASAIPVVFAWLISRLALLFGSGDSAGEPMELEENLEVIFETVGGAETPEWLIWTAIVLISAAFIAAVCAVIRRLTGSGGERERPERRAAYSTGLVQPAAHRRRVFGSSPADVVRSCYRKYLIICARRGITVSGSAASDEICRQSESLHAGCGAGELRELWLPARFSSEPVSESDAGEAKRALKSITRAFKQ